MKRLLAALGAALATMLLVAPPALAAPRANIDAPLSGTTVTGSVAVRVTAQWTPLLEATPNSVSVRASTDQQGTAATVALTCVENCDNPTAASSTWEGTLNPAGLSPGCNGRWYLQPGIDGSYDGQPWTELLVAVSPSGVGSLSADGDQTSVDLSWTRSSEPDLVGYEVHRRLRGQTNWSTAASIDDPDTFSFNDRGLEPGTYQYRVQTLRHDGREGGRSVAPCTDGSTSGRDALRATSSVQSATVTGVPPPSPSPSPSPNPSPSPTSDDDDDPNASPSPDGSEGASGGGGDPAPGASPDPSPDASPDTGAAGPPPSIAPPPSAERDEPVLRDLSPPPSGEAAAPPPPPEQFYGEGEGFSEDLGFGGVPRVSPSASPPGDDDGTAFVERVVPGGVRSFVETNLDGGRLLRPIAGGLVMIALALHLLRFLRQVD